MYFEVIVANFHGYHLVFLKNCQNFYGIIFFVGIITIFSSFFFFFFLKQFSAILAKNHTLDQNFNGHIHDHFLKMFQIIFLLAKMIKNCCCTFTSEYINGEKLASWGLGIPKSRENIAHYWETLMTANPWSVILLIINIL